ncbi:MAG: TMEM165/GDT1 family protein [Polyangiaceae bacterium]|jgi:putative Ca2+/H+ antiporter (TMEM165/GDT1 family)
MHAVRVALYVFGVIFVAELPDKTALAAFALATRHRPLPVFLGAALALAVQSLVAVVAGSLFALLPARPVHIGAGLVFEVSAIVMWIRKEDPEPVDERAKASGPSQFWRVFGSVFGVVFVAEWGDLTQIATAAFAARERSPWLVFGAATLALWTVTAVAVAAGNRMSMLLRPELMQKVAAVLFAAVGVALICGWL